MPRIPVAPDCHGRDIYKGDRVALELYPDDMGEVQKLERHGDVAWATVVFDDGREQPVETWRLEGSR